MFIQYALLFNSYVDCLRVLQFCKYIPKIIEFLDLCTNLMFKCWHSFGGLLDHGCLVDFSFSQPVSYTKETYVTVLLISCQPVAPC